MELLNAEEFLWPRNLVRLVSSLEALNHLSFPLLLFECFLSPSLLLYLPGHVQHHPRLSPGICLSQHLPCRVPVLIPALNTASPLHCQSRDVSRVPWAWLREGCVSRMGENILDMCVFTCKNEMLISEPKFSSLMVVCLRTGNAKRGSTHWNSL